MLGRVKGKKLVIEIRLQEPEPSRSGKTMIVGSTRGPRKSTVNVAGKPVFVNANAYIYPDKPADPAPTAGGKASHTKSAAKKSQRPTATGGAA